MAQDPIPSPSSFQRLVQPAGFEPRALAALRDMLGTFWFMALAGILAFAVPSDADDRNNSVLFIVGTFSIAWLWALAEVFGTATYGKLGTLRIRQFDGTRPTMRARVTRFLLRRIVLLVTTALMVALPLAKAQRWSFANAEIAITVLLVGTVIVFVADIAVMFRGRLTLHDRMSRTTVFNHADCQAIDCGRAVSALVEHRPFPVLLSPAGSITSTPPQSPAASPRPDA